MKWEMNGSCGNSPKNQMLIDWLQDYIEENENLPFITEKSEIIYKSESILLSEFSIPTGISEMSLDTAITHGRDGALLGKAILDKESYPFALFFKFSLGKQPKIKTVTCIVDSAE